MRLIAFEPPKRRRDAEGTVNDAYEYIVYDMRWQDKQMTAIMAKVYNVLSRYL